MDVTQTMPATTPAYAKNIIRRALRELIDPSPSKAEIASIWEFFESACAYCGRALRTGQKEAHIDHLQSASEGGSNHVANRVLSCATCNEKEKLDQPWEQFLRKKCSDKKTFELRRNKIQEWVKHASASASVLNPAVLHEVEASAEKVVSVFNKEVARIQTVTSNNSLQPTSRRRG